MNSLPPQHPSSQHTPQPGLLATPPQTSMLFPNPQLFGVGGDPATCRGLYIGNLDTKVTDALLYSIFNSIGPVESCKIIKDKNGVSAGYGFVGYFDHETADRALTYFNGRKVYNCDIKVNWATGAQKDEAATKDHYHIFVGDLSPEIDDKALFKAFSAFGSISDARVMWDPNTSRSRGYGFVAFRNKKDADRALNEMNGEWLGNRAIRCNWANQKNIGTETVNTGDYEAVLNQTSHDNTTVYVGNIALEVNDQYLRSVFIEFGFIEEVRMAKDKGYAFVKFQTHDQAARAIIGASGKLIGSKPVKTSWGKERAAEPMQLGMMPTPAGYPPVPPQYLYPPWSYPQHGMYNQQFYGAGYVGGQQYQGHYPPSPYDPNVYAPQIPPGY